MISIRKAWWATLLLTAFVGCTNEEPAGENPPPTAPAAPDATAPPAATPPAGEKAPEGGMSAELNKDEPAKPEGLPPTDVAPKEDAKELKLDAPAVTPPAKEEKKEAAASPLTAEELAELASLSAADKDLALKQVVCPVSGENLGSMGVPLKVSAEGKTFLICCKGCNSDVKENPKEVVAKLKN